MLLTTNSTATRAVSRVLILVLTLALSLVHTSDAFAGGKSDPPNKKASSKKKSKHRVPDFTGSVPAASTLRTEPLPRPSGHLELSSVNFKGETVSVDLYDQDGAFDDAALDELYHLWRCRRTGTEKPIDPHLFEVLSLIYDHFQQPLELVSGFRNQDHTTSYHFHGSAADIRVKGVPDKDLHEFVQSLDTGHQGFGRYPRAGFIHVDVRPSSYRWVDRSPPNDNMGHPKKSSKKKHNA